MIDQYYGTTNSNNRELTTNSLHGFEVGLVVFRAHCVPFIEQHHARSAIISHALRKHPILVVVVGW
jgi:hypothetical protein